jgi:hypothetical protein
MEEHANDANDASACADEIIQFLQVNPNKTSEELQKQKGKIIQILKNGETAETKATKILNVFFQKGYSGSQLAVRVGAAGLTSGIVGYTLGHSKGKKSKTKGK